MVNRRGAVDAHPICRRVVSPEEFAIRGGDSDECFGRQLHVLALALEVDGDGRGVGRSRTAETAETTTATAKAARTARTSIATTGSPGETANTRVCHASLKTGI